MSQLIRRALTMAAILAVTPVLGDDPPSAGQGTARAAEESASSPASEPTAGAEKVRAGAPGMEPQDADGQEDRTEREFVQDIWNSP
jgi:hypothetical protein